LTEPLPDAVKPSAKPARLFRLRRWRSNTALAVSLAVGALAAMPVYSAAIAQADSSVLLGAWTVHFTPSGFNAKGVNIRRPAQLINGTVVAPGGQFNFFKATGPYTTANGYSTGAAIVNGQIKPDGVLGGGLCSAATTLFNAAVRAGLTINKRTNHHFYITRYPVGLDATIWANKTRATANLVFTNDTANAIRIVGIGAKRSVTFQIWGVNDGRHVTWADPVITNIRPAGTNIVYSDDLAAGRQNVYLAASDGFDVVVGRTVTDVNGFVIHQDNFKSDYAPETGITKRGRYPGDPPEGAIYKTITPRPTPSPTPGPSGTPTPAPTGTPVVTATPTAPPTAPPTATPSAPPTATPTDTPTASPTDTPSPEPTSEPTDTTTP
jgi:VanW like protein